MTPPSPTGSWPLSPSSDRLCDRFESAWNAGRRPRIEEYLGETVEPVRTALLRELLAIELAYRVGCGEEPAAEEYRQRFPHLAHQFDALFRQAAAAELPTRPPGPPGPATTWPQIPGYEILAELEPGGMGVVYKARQTDLRRIVAVKKIRHEAHAGDADLARFQIEAEAVARLKHPHIVQIYEFGSHEGLPYFSMEFMEGGNLACKLQGNPMPAAEAAAMVEVLARAMHYAHGQSIVHRDLKPANVLLSADGKIPKVADFGLAKFLDDDRGLTVTKTVMGTASYMAPEQAAGKTREVGHAADVYALGAILYEMLAGRPPFRGETRELTIAQVLTDEPAPPSLLRPNVPVDLETICLKCLEKEPARRYASALDLAEDLERFCRDEPIQAGQEEWYPRWAPRVGYEILDTIGWSVLGMVYKARHTRLNRLSTFKTIFSRAQLDPDMLARFRVEAEAAARLQHPNIIQVYDYGEYCGQPYFSLEYLEGGSLVEKTAGRPHPAAEAAELVETLARAAHYAHRNGIIHADLRPWNILLTAAAVPKITGFGLARLLEKGVQELPQRRTVSNYMAPEQAEGRTHAIGPATDVHALGAMLYELLTGRPPFLADNVRDTLEQVRFLVPPPPSQVQPGVPPALDAICQRCLRKDPAERFASGDALAEALARFLHGKAPSTDEFELVPGYEVLEPLGQGGLGDVYKARQVRLDRLVALKLFREAWGRFLAANQAVARLHHPNLVEVYDCGERDGMLYVAEEYIDGGSLAARIAGTPQPVSEACRMVETLAQALDYVHRHGIIHRNLRPGVVLLTALGAPKISSFDVARLLGHAADEGEAGQRVGTPVYMAPEQIAGAANAIGPATDVHALGVILYEMLTGRPPYDAPTAAERLVQIESRPPVPLRKLQPQVPEELERVCLKCLEKNPERRYQRALALADDLHRCRVDLERPPGVWRRAGRWLEAWLGRSRFSSE